MTKGMAARAGFFSEFLGSNHKGNGGIRRRRGPCRPLNGRQAPVAPGVGDRPLSPVGGATGSHLFFSSPGTSLQIWREKITLWACRPMGGRPGYIFEIFQNGHIFLKF